MPTPRKITDLPIATTANAGDLLYIRQGTDDSQITFSNLSAAISGPTGALLAANNLSDLDNVATARSNLNVLAAGDTAALNASNDFDFNIQEKVRLQNYSETVVNGGNLNGTFDFDLENGNVFTGTVTGNVTFTFSNAPASGQAGSLVMILTDAGAHAITFPGSVEWAGGTAPVLTTAGVDLLIFTTVNGGTTWYGAVAALDLS